MTKISEMQNYIVNFAEENMQTETKKIEDTVKKYLLRLRTNVAELNNKYLLHLNSFNKEYKLCKKNLMEFNRICHSSTEKTQTEIKYNNKYVKTLHTIDRSLEKAVSALFQSNILGVMKTINNLCQKNDIVSVYDQIRLKLQSHFNLLTQEKIKEQTKNVDVQNDKQLDSFLQKVIVRIHQHNSIL